MKVGRKSMCGIVGVIGKQDATQVLLSGLQKLEYRGYDSAGIFVTSGIKGQLIKAQGRIQQLSEKVATVNPTGTTGIGHTRWATHGKPSETNAHPHISTSERFVLVHNGVIENVEKLKEQYQAEITLTSETDTEVIVQLIEYFVLKEKQSTLEAFQTVLKQLVGSYALVLIDQETPDMLYVAKNKSPLLIGVGSNFHVICSDALAMLDQTQDFIELHDGELAVLTADTVKILTQAGQNVSRTATHFDVSPLEMDKGTYPNYMLKEVEEQPSVVRRILQAYTDENQKLTIDSNIIEAIAKSDRIYIVACGTSWHAGLVGKRLIEEWTKKPVEVHLASEISYYPPIFSENPFFIYISQSGETADSRQVLVKTKAQGYQALVMTNVAGSTLAREADYTLLLHAGPEISVASTKAYTAQLALLTLVAYQLGQYFNNEALKSVDIIHELNQVADGMEHLIEQKSLFESLTKDYFMKSKSAFYIGRGIDYAVALEAALKLKEISYIQAEGFAAGELKHGPIALVEEGTPVVGLVTEKVTAGHLRSNLKEVESRGAHTLVIATAELKESADQIVLPAVLPILSPLLSIIPAQFFAYYATLEKGLDVDKPRNLAKSVTVE